jgi:SAM-dependent methyltransferase
MSVVAVISPDDTMFDSTIERYLDVGRSAAEAIRTIVGNAAVTSVLDLPCGHGRVLRHLAAEYPDAKIFVSDLDEPGMFFCEQNFGATALTSSTDFDYVDFGRKFDLIWSGSLITHLNAGDTRKFFRFISRHLSPSGFAVVSSHGEVVGARLERAEGWMYGLPDADQMAVHSQAMERGYGYARYPGWNVEYGISLATIDWLQRTAGEVGLCMTEYMPAAWDAHQDVLCLRPS